MRTAEKIEFGDFQTPRALADEVCALLHKRGERPDFVIEPTAGKGTFLLAAGKVFASAALRGWEINHEYVEEARKAFVSEFGAAVTVRVQIACQDFFTHDWDAELGATMHGSLLLLGNPP